MRSGVAIQRSLHVLHIFTVQSVLPDQLLDNIDLIASLVDQRLKQSAYWEERTRVLLPESDPELREIKDPALRRLLRGAPDYAALSLLMSSSMMSFFKLLVAKITLCFKVYVKASRSSVRSSARVAGQSTTRRSRRSRSRKPSLGPGSFARRSSEDARQCVPVSDNLRSLWKSTMGDVLEGSTVGPSRDEDDVSAFLGCSDWTPTQRFEVVQKKKVRGNVLFSASSAREWVLALLKDGLDERMACRQLPILPQHRKFSVICLKDPEDGRPKYVVMIALLVRLGIRVLQLQLPLGRGQRHLRQAAWAR